MKAGIRDVFEDSKPKIASDCQKPGRRPGTGSLSLPSEEQALRTPWFWTFGLQNVRQRVSAPLVAI